MRTAAIMQPAYLPWCGFFDLLDRADIFILDDLSQFVAKSWHCRNRIRARDGQTIWLSIPVHAHRRPICEIETANDAWRLKHWRTLKSAYQHAPYWDRLEQTLVPQPGPFPPVKLPDVTATILRILARELGITTTIVHASNLGSTRAGRLERIQDFCQIVAADKLLNTIGARAMFDGHDIGIPIEWVDYQPAPYEQGGMPWQSHLSVVDLLAFHGPNALNIIRQGSYS